MDRSKPIKVLVVEDNPNDQELLQRQLCKADLAEFTLFLDDPEKALDLLQDSASQELKERLGAILLDVHLPHMSGIDLLRILRTVDGLADIPVMVMTSCPHPDIVEACHQLNVTLAEKPITVADFSTVIAPLLNSIAPQRATSSRVPSRWVE